MRFLAQQTKHGWVLLLTLLLVLAGCDTATTPPPPSVMEASGFTFQVDPQAETLTLVETTPSDLQPQFDPSDSRILIPFVDIALRDLSFKFSDKMLTIRVKFENLTEHDFAQPFFFTLNSESANFVRAYAPLVTDEQLGGDGVLSPGEVSARLLFKVKFAKDEAFTFLVDTNAVVGDKATCAEPIYIPDTRLEAAIRNELSKSSDEDLTCEDMAALTQLDAIYSSIANLEGLQYAVNLEELVILGNAIDDLSPLQGLTNLTSLNLSDNAISDISSLQGLTQLVDLSLSDNAISNLTPLQSLTNLTGLEVAGNALSDLSALQNLTNLTDLYLHKNAIGDLTPLQNLTNLEQLRLSNNDVSDLAPLQGLTNLDGLGLDGNSVREIGALLSNGGLDEGDRVDLTRNPLSRAALEDVETLRARGVQVLISGATCTDPLTIPDANLELIIREELGISGDLTCEDMTGLLNILDSAERPVASLEGLQYADYLDFLQLGPGTIDDLTPLQKLSNMYILGLNGNDISDLTPLEDLTALTFLALVDNEIEDLSPLADLSKLTALFLSNNSVSDLTPLTNLSELRELALGGNALSDLAPLETFTELSFLNLSNNNIRDIGALVGNSGLGEGDFVDLRDNPLSAQALEDAETLRARGVNLLATADACTEPVFILDDRLEAAIRAELDKPRGDLTCEEMATLIVLQDSVSGISSLEGLQNAVNLEFLSLAFNTLEDLAPLQGLTGLIHLELTGNDISDLNPLRGLTNLEVLALTSNPISDLEPLQNLSQLRELHLNNTGLVDVTPLQELTSLTYLDLNSNYLSDITPLEGLTNLTYLDLSRNEVSDIGALVNNSGLGAGDIVKLSDYALSQEALDDVETLRARGVEVTL